MKFLVLCCAVTFVAVASAGPLSLLGSASNLVPLPSVLPSAGGVSYYTLFKTISSVHSALSKTPLKAFLPSVTDMVMGAYTVAKTAYTVEEAVRKANDYVTNVVKQAAEKAKMPLDSLSQLTSQAQATFGQAFQSAESAGSQVSETVQGSVAQVLSQSPK